MAQASKPVTPEMFRELVTDLRGELAEASVLQRERLLARPVRQAAPASFEDRAWVRRRVTLHEAADLTGFAYNSLRVYRAAGNKARAGGSETGRHMPAESGAGGWVLAGLALWLATRNEGHARGAAKGFSQGHRWPGRETYLPPLRAYVDGVKTQGRHVVVAEAAAHLGVEKTLARKLLRHIGALPHRHTDAEILAWMRDIAEQEGRRFTLRELLERAAGAGMGMRRDRATRLYLAAGGRLIAESTADGPEPGPLESLRNDGLITQAQVARGYEVSEAHVWKARQQRDDGVPPLIMPVKWENDRPLYDPAALTYRSDLLVGPVRKGHPLAAELGAYHHLRRGIGYGRPQDVPLRS